MTEQSNNVVNSDQQNHEDDDDRNLASLRCAEDVFSCINTAATFRQECTLCMHNHSKTRNATLSLERESLILLLGIILANPDSRTRKEKEYISFGCLQAELRSVSLTLVELRGTW